MADPGGYLHTSRGPVNQVRSQRNQMSRPGNYFRPTPHAAHASPFSHQLRRPNPASQPVFTNFRKICEEDGLSRAFARSRL
ncbi:hypothetical protein BJX76DRAFT_328178 [Aspergillus varians]